MNIAKIKSKQLPSAQPEPQWIPCSKRLPEKIVNGEMTEKYPWEENE